MRILAITTLYPRPSRELIASFNRQQFAALARRQELRVIAPVGWREALQELTWRRSPARPYVNRDGIEVEHPVYYYPPGILRHRYGQFYWHSIRKTAVRAICDFRPEALLACWAHPDGWAAVQLGREFGLPVVIKVIGSDLLVSTRHSRRRALVRETLAQADMIAAVGRNLAEQAIHFGANPDRVCVVPEGLDDRLFYPGDRLAARRKLGLPFAQRILLFVGNLLWSKGVGVLVEACQHLLAQGEQFHCYFVGRGADAARLRSLIKQQRLERHIALAGSCRHADLPEWYRAADLVALPSFSEGIPNVLREAIACGRPFVATRVGGIPEIAHPAYSRLTAPGDALALADAVRGMLASPPAFDRRLVQATNVSCDRSAQILADCVSRAISLGDRRTPPAAADEERLISALTAESINAP